MNNNIEKGNDTRLYQEMKNKSQNIQIQFD